jgi:predicted ArsR family transcriptional regulator
MSRKIRKSTKTITTKKQSPTAKPVRTAAKTRDGTKQAQIIIMLRSARGATIDEMAEATGWQGHTVRGALAGALKKRLGLNVTSEKVEDRGRVYRLQD